MTDRSSPRSGSRAASSGTEHRRTRGAFAVVALCALMAGCSRPQDQSAVERLTDRGPKRELAADNTWRRVLDPTVAEHRFTVDADDGARVLAFPGIEWNSPSGPVLFEMTWQRGAEPPVTIYSRELSEPGWSAVDITLPSPGPGDLRLRKTAARRSRAGAHAAWGNPIVLAGSVPARPSVILVSLDTLRADRLGVYGRRQARTPILDQFARHSVRYDQAYSPSTWTAPSHQSMLFGIYPWGLAATRNKEGPRDGWSFSEFESLADAFHRAGYLTAAFTGGGFVAPGLGLSQGFDDYFAYRAAPSEEDCPASRFDGPEVLARAADWLRARAHTAFFLFIHTYEAHDRCPVHPARSTKGFSPAEREAVSAYYDDMVARADAFLGNLLRELDSLGLADSTLIAVTSDHGEAMWEHGFWNHGCDSPPYEELSRVPLMLRIPSAARRTARIDTPVSTVDLAPTLLALTGIPVPPTMHGGVLPGLGLPADANRPVYVHCGDWLSVRQGTSKYLVSSQGPETAMLFDLRDDPEERVDLAGDPSSDRDGLEQLARGYWSHTFVGPPVPPALHSDQQLDPATAERLRALGYAR